MGLDVNIKIYGNLRDARLLKRIFKDYLPKARSFTEKSSVEHYISLVDYAEKRAKENANKHDNE